MDKAHMATERKKKVLIGAQPGEHNFSFFKKLSPDFNPVASDVATQQNILNYQTFFFFLVKDM